MADTVGISGHVLPQAQLREGEDGDEFTKLNKRVRRSIHGSPTARQIRERFKPSSRYFAALDLNHGYFQIELAEESKNLTTFIVSQNDTAVRYRYNRAPQGLASSGDEFCARTDLAFE